MKSEILEKARSYEKEEEKKILKEERPGFHLSPRVGWMNDPNGFGFYNGKYHVFYQYYPYSSNWGPMHWGHAVSDDLVKWEYMPAAIAPDEKYDEVGCFSGSSTILDDGRQLIMYTGVHKVKESDGSERDVQEQCIAVGDGKEYEKYESNPVITADMLPEGSSKYDFRDPKIWKTAENTYRCIVGSCDDEKDGRLLIFESRDGFKWNFVMTLEKNEKRYGKMWECPDYFQAGGKEILITSPQEMFQEEHGFHGGNGTLFQVGHLGKDGVFVEEKHQMIDAGIDFYAAQTMAAPDGRRIMIAWMQNWDTCRFNPPEVKWFGELTIAREICVENGRLIQNPVREIEKYRTNHVRYDSVVINGEKELDGIKGRKLDLFIKVKSNKNVPYYKFGMKFAKKDDRFVEFNFRPNESLFTLDRRFEGVRTFMVHNSECVVTDDQKDGSIEIRVLIDKYSVEIFLNGGKDALTMTYDRPLDADEILFFADGEAVIDIEKYEIQM